MSKVVREIFYKPLPVVEGCEWIRVDGEPKIYLEQNNHEYKDGLAPLLRLEKERTPVLTVGQLLIPLQSGYEGIFSTYWNAVRLNVLTNEYESLTLSEESNIHKFLEDVAALAGLPAPGDSVWQLAPYDEGVRCKVTNDKGGFYANVYEESNKGWVCKWKLIPNPIPDGEILSDEKSFESKKGAVNWACGEYEAHKNQLDIEGGGHE
ncbi:MAG: hypothetical protein ISN29_08890 [Gammaproteobacteria bacterium AqS3]|nr:hypothetical protein [Gammaproteobacteria bacterium AqS3]